MPARPDPPRRLVFLHGFTQTHHHWHRCAQRIAHELGGHTTLAFVDLPGHGLSADDRTGIQAAGPALARLIDGRIVVGYSMGARFALVAALAGGTGIDRLVLVSGTAGLADEGERADRRAADDRLAAHLEDVGVDAFVEEWLALPLFASLPADRAEVDHRRRNTVAGLAASLRTAGTGAMPPLWSALTDITMPVLVVAGELDEKFTAIGRRMVDALPDGTFVSIADAGHAVHAERPQEVSATIAGWIRSLDAPDPPEPSASSRP